MKKKIRSFFDVIVANRTPFNWDTYEFNHGGLATACIGMMRPGSTWYGVYDGSRSHIKSIKRVQSRVPGSYAVVEKLPGRRNWQIGLELDKKDATGHYHWISNGVLWPIHHGMPEHVFGYDDERRDQYYAVNRRFSKEVMGSQIFINDYHLKPLSKMMRKENNKTVIVYFSHTPMWSMNVYKDTKKLPDHEGIQKLLRDGIEELLYADLVGFQIPSDVKNYLEAVEHFVSGAKIKDNNDGSFTVTYNNRKIRAEAFPISIDTETVREYIEGTTINYTFRDGTDLSEEIEKAREEADILACKIGRLDYTKEHEGNMYIAWDLAQRLFQKGKKLKYFVIGGVTRESLPAYLDTRSNVIKAAEDINHKSREIFGYDVVFFRDEYIPFGESSLNLMKACHIYLDASGKDGKHLTPEEATEVKASLPPEKRGIIVMGKDTGTGWQHKDAGFGPEDGILIINPADIKESAEKIMNALDNGYNVSDKLIKFRRKNDVRKWANDIQESLEKAMAVQLNYNL